MTCNEFSSGIGKNTQTQFTIDSPISLSGFCHFSLSSTSAFRLPDFGLQMVKVTNGVEGGEIMRRRRATNLCKQRSLLAT